MTSSTTTVASFTSPGNEEDGIAGVSIAAAGICVVVSVFVASVIGIARAMAKPYPTDNMMGDTSQNKIGKVDEATGVEGLDKSNGKWVDAFCAQTEDKEKELRVAAEGESPATLSVNLKIPQRPWSAPGGSRRDSRKMKQKIKQKHIVDDDLIAARQRRQTDLALSEVDDQQEGLQSVTNSSSVQTLHPQHIQVGTQKSPGSSVQTLHPQQVQVGTQKSSGSSVQTLHPHQVQVGTQKSSGSRMARSNQVVDAAVYSPNQRQHVLERGVPNCLVRQSIGEAWQPAITLMNGQTWHGQSMKRGMQTRARVAWPNHTSTRTSFISPGTSSDHGCGPGENPGTSPSPSPSPSPLVYGSGGQKPARHADTSSRAASRYLMNFLKQPGVGGNNRAAPAVATAAAMLAARMWGPLQCKCGSMFMSDEVHCRSCGARRAVEQCIDCGVPFKSGDSFCGQCGAQRRKPDHSLSLQDCETDQPPSCDMHRLPVDYQPKAHPRSVGTDFGRGPSLRSFTRARETSPESLSRVAPRQPGEGDDSDNSLTAWESGPQDAQQIEDNSDLRLGKLQGAAESPTKSDRPSTPSGIKTAWPEVTPTTEPQMSPSQNGAHALVGSPAGVDEAATHKAGESPLHQEASQTDLSDFLEVDGVLPQKEASQRSVSESLGPAVEVPEDSDVTLKIPTEFLGPSTSLPQGEGMRLSDADEQEEYEAEGLKTAHNPLRRSPSKEDENTKVASPRPVQAHTEEEEVVVKEAALPPNVLEETVLEAELPTDKTRIDMESIAQEQDLPANLALQSPSPSSPVSTMHDEREPGHQLESAVLVEQVMPLEAVHQLDSAPQAEQVRLVGTEPKDSAIADAAAPEDDEKLFEETMSLHQLLALETLQESLAPTLNTPKATPDETSQSRMFEEESEAFKQLNALEMMASAPLKLSHVQTQQSEAKDEVITDAKPETAQLPKKSVADESDAAFKQLEALEKLAASTKESMVLPDQVTNVQEEQLTPGGSPMNTPRPGSAGSLDPPFIPMQPPSSRSSGSSDRFPLIRRQPVPGITWNKMSGRPGGQASARSVRSVSTAPSRTRSPNFGQGPQKRYGMYRNSFNSSNSDSDGSMDTVH